MLHQEKILNIPAIRRMPTYLHKLLKMQAEGKVSVSSTELAEYMNIELIVVRKDISLTGISGQRRIGYDVNELIRYIKAYLGWEETIPAALVGAGSLGTALLGYDDFEHYGFRIEWVFDSSPDKIGTEIYGREVLDVRQIASQFAVRRPEIAVICVSNAAAQEVADQLVASGIRYIWNFANVSLNVPPGVVVQREVIAGGLAMLAVRRKMDRKRTGSNLLQSVRKKLFHK
ncbi:MAG: redox-sensing transcriptional repressor Rex [Lentisphaeria bacterium]|nr:redox-sensing transcriptional repressor Rex [Lentisphaeria bacterium]